MQGSAAELGLAGKKAERPDLRRNRLRRYCAQTPGGRAGIGVAIGAGPCPGLQEANRLHSSALIFFRHNQQQFALGFEAVPPALRISRFSSSRLESLAAPAAGKPSMSAIVQARWTT